MSETILPEDYLLRRVNYTLPNQVKPDGSPTSYAFMLGKKDKDGLSVDLERLLDYDISIQDESVYKLYKVLSEIPMNLNLKCIHNPKKDNPAHSLIKGIPKKRGNRSKQIRRKLARAAVLHSRPE